MGAEALGQNHAAIGGGVEAQQIPVVVVAKGMVGVDLTNMDRVAEHAVAVRIGAGADGGCVHARDGRKHRMAVEEIHPNNDCTMDKCVLPPSRVRTLRRNRTGLTYLCKSDYSGN